MAPSDLRKQAREALKNNWGKAILLFLAYFFFILILDSFEKIFFRTPSLSLAYGIFELVIAVPIAFGLSISFLNLKRHKTTTAFSFITEGFGRFGKCWNIYLWVLLKMLIPICCFIMAIILLAILVALKIHVWLIIVIGIAAYLACLVYAVARGLLYSLIYYIACDEPELTGKEIVNKSEELMTGNRGNLFMLELSFIGWLFLGFLTFGIGLIWVVPYMQVTVACFYEELAKTNVKEVEETAKVEESVQE